MLTRRFFLRASAVAMAGVGVAPSWLVRAAAEEGRRRKILVAIFQRGAADGLNVVVPFFEKRYYDLRPTIAVPEPGKPNGAIDLDGRFALHPSPSVPTRLPISTSILLRNHRLRLPVRLRLLVLHHSACHATPPLLPSARHQPHSSRLC